jgi:N-sulfoglucosamine sulfohydrolase
MFAGARAARAERDRRRRQSIAAMVCASLTAAFAIVGSLSGARVFAQDRPNILLITVDDMDWKSLGVTGAPIHGISPNTDRLAREGILFTNAHVTVAICQPSRNVLLTGRYPQNTGALGFEDIKPEIPTVIEALAQAGYYTGVMAKTGHVVPSRAHAWNELVPAKELQNGRSPRLYFERTRDFLARSQATGKPFFLMVNSQDPHRPFAGSDQEVQFKARDATNTDPQYGGGFPEVEHQYTPGQVRVPGFLPDLPEVRREVAEYYTSVRRADETTGAVLRALDAAGLADGTLVIWLSDNGMALPFAKANVWLHSTRTPLIIRWPHVVSHGRTDDRHFIGGIDLTPTILDAAKLPNLRGAEGRSFVPLLRGKSQGGRDYVFTQIDGVSSGASYPMRAVTGAEYGYIFNAWADGKTELRIESMVGRTFPAMRAAAVTNAAIAARIKHFVYREKEELYDYRHDPDALHNLTGNVRYANVAAKYRQLLLRHLKESGDPILPVFEQFLAEKR